MAKKVYLLRKLRTHSLIVRQAITQLWKPVNFSTLMQPLIQCTFKVDLWCGIIVTMQFHLSQDTRKQCGPICFVEGKIREHYFALIKKQLIWLFKKKTLKLVWLVTKKEDKVCGLTPKWSRFIKMQMPLIQSASLQCESKSTCISPIKCGL